MLKNLREEINNTSNMLTALEAAMDDPMFSDREKTKLLKQLSVASSRLAITSIVMGAATITDAAGEHAAMLYLACIDNDILRTYRAALADRKAKDTKEEPAHDQSAQANAN